MAGMWVHTASRAPCVTLCGPPPACIAGLQSGLLCPTKPSELPWEGTDRPRTLAWTRAQHGSPGSASWSPPSKINEPDFLPCLRAAQQPLEPWPTCAHGAQQPSPSPAPTRGFWEICPSHISPIPQRLAALPPSGMPTLGDSQRARLRVERARALGRQRPGGRCVGALGLAPASQP